VPSIVRLRRGLPLVAFVFLFILVVMLVGFACACFGDTPMQAAERAANSGVAIPAVIEVWAMLAAVLFPITAILTHRFSVRGRASPPLTQRFLF
jgi:hypothetical protein